MPLSHRIYTCMVRVMLGFGAFLSLPALATDISTLSRYNLRPGVTEISRDVYDLHNFTIWVCVAIAIVVYGALLFSIYKYRRSKGAKAAKFSHSMKAEVVWTLIPVIILVIIGIPAINVLAKMYDAEASEIDVLVTGYQWKWSYEYLGEDVSFFSSMTSDKPQEYSVRDQIANAAPKDTNYLLVVDNPLVIPVDTKVRFLITANDVMHSWWVPDFAVKRDAIPGYVNEAWVKVDTEGTYRGQCAELCGKDHAYMPVVVEVVGKQEYQDWLAERKAENEAAGEAAQKEWTSEDLLARGEAVYTINCVACHQINGTGNPPIFPSLAGSPKVVGDAAVTIDTLLNGVQGSAMQAFGKQLGDADIAAVVSYIRSSWGNDASLVQPATVAEARAAFSK